MKRWKLVLKVTLLLCVLLLSACAVPPMAPSPAQSAEGGDAATVEANIPEAINVGLLLPFSGEYGWVGDHILPVVQMVTDEVNEGGGIDGAELQVIQADSIGDADIGAAAGKKLLAEDGVVALLGPTSLSFPGVRPLLEEYQTPMVSPTAGTPALDRAGQMYFFRTVPSDSQGGVVIAEAINNSSTHLDRDPFANIVLMMTQAPVYTSFQDTLNQGMAAAGSQFAATIPIEQAQADYSEPLREALAFDPDLIVLINDPADSANILATAAQMGYDGNWFFAQDQTTDEFIALAGSDVTAGAFGMMEVPAAASAERAAAFAEQFLAATGQEAQRFATSTYDAANILYLATLRASLRDGIVNNETVAANIHRVADPGEGKVDVYSFSEGRQALEASDEINYQGLDGPMDFDEYGNVGGSYGIFQVQAGDWVQISTVTADDLTTPEESDGAGSTDTAIEDAAQQEILFQHSTLDALLAGVYDGQLPIGELKQHGDFGLGTFDALNGEMVVAGGEVYQVDDQGVVHVADDAKTTPFAAVTFFEPELTATLDESYSCAQLHGYLDAFLPATNVPYAIRVHGMFPTLTVRSVPAQEPPYAPLAEVLVDQVVFEKQDISGALIGLRLPDYLAGANVAGYHFHFISDDRQVGGHVLDCTTAAVIVAAVDIKDIQIDLPQNKAFQEATLPDADASAAAVETPIILGALYNLTGPQAGLDIPSAQGAQLAVDQANEAGGVLGKPVQLVIEDGESDLTVTAEKMTEMLTNDADVAAFMGLSDTDFVLAAAPVAVNSGRLFLTSGATSPKLPAHAPGFLFLAAFGDNVQAAAGAEWAYDDLAARTVSVLYQSDSTYTQLLEGYFRTRFEELGGQVLSVAGYTPGEDLGPSIAQLQPADLFYLAATPDDLRNVVLALRAAGYDQPILGGDGFDAPDLWSQQPEVGDIFFTTHAYLGEDNDAPQIVAFRQAYAQAYPDAIPDAFAALGYDAARLLLTAIDRAGSAAPEAVRSSLSGIRDFDGVTGQLGYQAGSRIPVKSVTILGLSNTGVEAGAYTLVAERMPDRVPQP